MNKDDDEKEEREQDENIDNVMDDDDDADSDFVFTKKSKKKSRLKKKSNKKKPKREEEKEANEDDSPYIVDSVDNNDDVSVNEKEKKVEESKVMKKGQEPNHMINMRMCSECNIEVAYGSWKNHISTVHKKGRAPCPECGIMMLQKSLLKHMKIIHQKDSLQQLKCDECKYVTIAPERLRRHVENVHSNKNYACHVCGKTFGSNAILVCHVKSHGEKTKCDFCDYQTAQPNAMLIHVKARHSSVSKVVYYICSFETHEKNILKDHLLTLHGVHSLPVEDEKKYYCDKCSFTCRSLGGSKVHKRTNHLGVRYKCDKCDFKSTQRSQVKIHDEKVHLKIKHSCRFCDQKSTDKHAIRQHELRKHKDQLIIYSCHLCAYQTEHKDLLQRHLTGKYGKHRNG